MTENNAWLLILKLLFLCFSGVATASNLTFSAPGIVCHHVGIPASLVSFPIVFISWWKDSPCVMLLNCLRDFEESQPSHSYCTLIIRKNLTAVSKGRDIYEL